MGVSVGARVVVEVGVWEKKLPNTAVFTAPR